MKYNILHIYQLFILYKLCYHIKYERGVIMESLTTAISVQVDRQDKELATGILSNLGLNMSTYVNMAIKQLINKNGVPFEIVNPRPSKELLEAFAEIEEMRNNPDKYPRYSNREDLKKALLSDE